MQKTINQKLFQTFDLGLAAALISAGFQLFNLSKSSSKKVQFCFDYLDGIDQTIEDYFADNLQVNARTFMDNIKMLKNRIYTNL